jgi:small subunit ribosomal protein S4
MAGLFGPVGKASRRLGIGITAKGERILAKRPTPPGQHGNSGRPKKISDYGSQLIEKQKIRFLYGLRESQFERTFKEALRMHGPTGENLVILLERRLDNVIYRQGLADTRRQARQLVNHGHFAVNGVATDIPSYRVRPGDVITIREKSRNATYFKTKLNPDLTRLDRPAEWFEQIGTDRAGWKIARFPLREEGERDINEQVVVEFYSR